MTASESAAWRAHSHRPGGSASTGLRRVRRQAIGVERPSLDLAPTPDRGAAELADRLRKTGSGCEHFQSLRLDTGPLRDIDGDDQLRARINLPRRDSTEGRCLKSTRARLLESDARA